MNQRKRVEGGSQERRLRVKSQDQRLRNLAVAGTRISPWEADVLVDMVKEVYFCAPVDRPLRSGQTTYECVAESEGAGKPVAACQLKTVVLTLLDGEDHPVRCLKGHEGLRRHRILRLADEARDQGGLLSQEDLAYLLSCDVRTIRRDVRELRERAQRVVRTRGQEKDIGPGVTHREAAVRLWLEGKEPVEVAQALDHTLTAVERYIGHFCRVVFLLWKRLDPLQIALVVGISSGSVGRYLDLYHKYHRISRYRRRLEEVEIIAGPHYEAEDQKKGPTRSARRNGGGRRP